MQRIDKKITLWVCASLLIWLFSPATMTSLASTTHPAGGSQNVFIPIVMDGGGQQPTGPRVNLPIFPVSGSADSYFNQAAIFWFGQVSSSSIYADVRIAGTQTELYVSISIFDQLLWYNTNPSTQSLTQWDSTTLYLRLAGNQVMNLDSNSYRFDSQFSWYEPRPAYQAAYRGNGSGWTQATTPFTTTTAYRGLGGPNTGKSERGWAATYHIPYASLGLSGSPADGTLWQIALAVHNRNSQAGPPQNDVLWPVGVNTTQPASWAQLHYGIPVYTPPNLPVAGTTTIRNKLDGVTVPDGNVGGVVANQCPGDENFIWNSWGNANYSGETGLNIQNQSNVDDWPCFSKYYVTFPLGTIPTGKTILKATLVLHQWGGSGDILGGHPPQPSYIQIFTVGSDFDPATLSWNNGPQPLENVSAAWVDPESDYNIPWPKYERDWDLTRALASAYGSGQPLRLAMYSGDSEFNSGKFFSTSDTQDWNAAGRPTLIIQWGN